jgi:hypothetical protein
MLMLRKETAHAQDVVLVAYNENYKRQKQLQRVRCSLPLFIPLSLTDVQTAQSIVNQGQKLKVSIF